MKMFNLPDLGEGLQDAAIVEWHVKPGEAVAADQAMVSVETDKAIVEIPAPHEGTIEKLFGAPGDKIRVGAPLVAFAGQGADTGTVVGDLAVREEVKATPAIRALARSLNVDLATVRASGPGGIVTSEDVKNAARGSLPRQGNSQNGLRAAMARNMTLAHREVAAVTLMDDADVEHWDSGSPVLARLVRALLAGCRAEPALNAWYDAKAERRQVREEIDLGIAVDLTDGLLVPVLRDAQRISWEELPRRLDELAKQARERKLAPDRLRGATITLSNFGTLGGRYASPIVVPPSVAILGAGRMAKAPVVDDSGALAVHRVLPLSLTFDHRALTGGEAARFLAAVISDLET
jgi:pyruvate dehydrogenase E2 component (dihydrolipoamide acetyltransferase)